MYIYIYICIYIHIYIFIYLYILRRTSYRNVTEGEGDLKIKIQDEHYELPNEQLLSASYHAKKTCACC